jgi:hypothetical protein
MLRLSATTKAGIALIVAPSLWLGSWALWDCTRNWIPLRTPLSGEAGHVRSSDFKINLEGDYSIGLATFGPPQDCAEKPGTRWSLFKSGSIFATGQGESRTGLSWPEWACAIGRFHAGTGAYRLDLNVPEHSRLLVVYEDGGVFINSIAHGAHAFMVWVSLLPVSLATLVIGAIRRREQKEGDAARQWTFTQPGPLQGTPIPAAPLKVGPWRSPKQVAPATFSVTGPFNLNQHTASVVQVLMPLCVVVALAMPMPWSPSHGFAIRTVRSGVRLLPAAGIMPLRIRVLAGKQAYYGSAPIRSLQIGSQIIEPADFPAFLRHEIPKRPSDWPVYIEADPDLEYEGVARAIDAVSVFRAKVVLLTPRLKADLGEPAR